VRDPRRRTARVQRQIGVAGDGAAATAGAGAGTNLAYFAHLGDVFAAYVYAHGVDVAEHEPDPAARMNVPDADEPPAPFRNPPRRERGDEVDDVVAKSKARSPPSHRGIAVTAPPSRAPTNWIACSTDLAARHRQPDV
jgi:hypothetical protein